MRKEKDTPDLPDRNPFPQTLYQILEECSKQDFRFAGARWSGGGSEIEISQPSFVANTLSKYFRTTKYTSFSRNLNLYGFKKNPAATGIYSHPEFRQSDFETVKAMRRPRKKQNTKTVDPVQTPLPKKYETKMKKSYGKDRKHALSSSVTPDREEQHSAFTLSTGNNPPTKERRNSRDVSRGTKRGHSGTQERRTEIVCPPPSHASQPSPEKSKIDNEHLSKKIRKRQKLMKENVGNIRPTLASVIIKKVKEIPAESNRDPEQELPEPPLNAPRKLVRLVSRDNQMTLLEQVFPNDAFLQFPTSTNCSCNRKGCVYCSSNCDSPMPSDAFPKTPPQNSMNGEHHNRAISPLSLSSTIELDLHTTRGCHTAMPPSFSSFFC